MGNLFKKNDKKTNDYDDYYNNENEYYSNQNSYNDKRNDNYDKVYNSYDKGKKSNSNEIIKIVITKVVRALCIVIIIGIIAYVLISFYVRKDDIINAFGKQNNSTETKPFSVNVNTTELSFEVGMKQKIEYEMINGTDVNLITFSSSNTNIATVDNVGNVTGISEGNATIIIAYNGENGIVIKMCPVTVISNVVTPTPTASSIPIPTKGPYPTTTIVPHYTPSQKEIDDARKRAEEQAKKRAEEARNKITGNNN